MGDNSGPAQETEGAGNSAPANWTWRTAVTKAEAFIRQHELPAPSRPAGLGKEYDFPTDARTLTSLQLGTLRLRLSAFHGYVLYLLGREDVELGAFEAVYDMVLGDAMQKVANASVKRMVTDVLRSVTVDGSETLKGLFRSITDRRARVGLLKSHLAVYEAHLNALSREQSRREMEARTGVV